MKVKEFRELTESEKVALVNKRLIELKNENKDVKEFKNDSLDFSYPTAVKEMEILGYARHKDCFEKEVKLSESEIRLLKNLAYSYRFVMEKEEVEPKIKKRHDDSISTTSIRMYNKVWKRWQAFSSEWDIYNSTDLIATALEEYMNRLGFEDYDTLLKVGKIVEKK